MLLERRDTIAPQVGASIGIGPNGGRVSSAHFSTFPMFRVVDVDVSEPNPCNQDPRSTRNL